MSLWTAQQHEWLRALGHPVLLLAGDPSCAAGGDAVAVEPARERPQLDGRGSGATVSVKHAGVRSARAATRGEQPRIATPGQHRTAEEAGSAPVSHDPATQPPGRPRPLPPPAEPGSPAPARTRPRSDAAAKAAALREARLAARPDVPRDDPLYQAVARATGLEASAAERVLAKMNIDWARLGADPAAKRALWVRLRRLRRERKP